LPDYNEMGLPRVLLCFVRVYVAQAAVAVGAGRRLVVDGHEIAVV
jgi:hypothetical protein